MCCRLSLQRPKRKMRRPERRKERRRSVLTALIITLALLLAGSARAEAGGPERLPLLSLPAVGAAGEAGGLPLQVRSEEGDVLQAEVSGLMRQPFAEVAQVLTDPANWCDFVPLSFNVKACTFSAGPKKAVLTFYAGRKFYQPPADAHSLSYAFTVEEASEEGLRIALRALEGPFGTRDYRIELDILPAGEGTALRLCSSYRPSLRSKLATEGYLATLGRNKIGFSVSGRDETGQPLYVQGVKGIVERNAVRYFLALQAFLGTRHIQPGERFEARLRAWFDMTEAFRAQLHEMERGDYLQMKRRERANQLRLQQTLSRETVAARFD